MTVTISISKGYLNV